MRDPRTEPMPGDVLMWPDPWTITEIDGEGTITIKNKQGHWTCCSLKTWRTWALDAQIVKQAKEQNDVEA